jgi:hypothetical protein
MCVTFLGNNQHSHSSHKDSSAPLHNLNKQKHKHKLTIASHRHVCMHAHGQLISQNLCCVKMLQLGFSDDEF